MALVGGGGRGGGALIYFDCCITFREHGCVKVDITISRRILKWHFFTKKQYVKDVITNPFKRETISSLHNLSVSDIFRDKKEAIVPCHMWPVLWITIYLQPDWGHHSRCKSWEEFSFLSMDYCQTGVQKINMIQHFMWNLSIFWSWSTFAGNFPVS